MSVAWLPRNQSTEDCSAQASICSGTKETIYINTSHHAAFEIYSTEGVKYADMLGAPQVHGKYTGFMLESLRHFADCVCYDQTPLVSGEDGLEVTRVLCAIEESARTGLPIEIAR